MENKIIKLSSLKADLARESAGDWIEYPLWAGAAFNVSSFHKPEYQTARDLLVARMSRESRGKKQPTGAETRAAYGELFCEHILHGWRGFDIVYTPDTAREILTDPAYRVIYDAVEWCAGQLALVEAEFVEDAGKNSEQPSAGGSKGKQLATG